MITLYEKLKEYSLEDAIKFEESDRQFLALVDLYKNKSFSDEDYLFLTIANALVCYQLSGKGEDYWEEFSCALKDRRVDDFSDVELFFEDFLPNSKNNKRLLAIKLCRIKKLKKFYLQAKHSDTLRSSLGRFKLYYKDMNKLAQDLSKVMGQKSNAKTIVFAVKMFSYAARNVFGCIEYFPDGLMLPIDSRLEKLYCKYNSNKDITKREVEKFYIDLAKKLNISPLHLDALLWLNYDQLCS